MSICKDIRNYTRSGRIVNCILENIQMIALNPKGFLLGDEYFYVQVIDDQLRIESNKKDSIEFAIEDIKSWL